MYTSHLKIKDIPESDRPYEKLEALGPSNLTDAELLAIIIKSGNRSETSLQLSQRLLSEKENNLNNVLQTSLEELMKIKGIGRVKAVQIKAALELGKRLVSFKNSDKLYIRSSQDVAGVLMEEMRFYTKEYVKVLLLNTKCQLMKIADVSMGSLNSSIVHPREVFAEAIKCGCNSIILVHNHPSGDPVPSNEDLNITKRLVDAGKILGIELLDHIIIGNKIYRSLKDEGII